MGGSEAVGAVTAPTRVVVAGDIGGTSSRLVIAPLEGPVIAEVTGPGANLRSSGAAALEMLAGSVRDALRRGRQALGGDTDVAAVALGISGAGPARAPEVRRALGEQLSALGVATERVLITDDHLTAFLSGEVGDDGLLMIAGTGAVTVRFAQREPVARRDGMGWLLGDVGSAVWLGRRTLEAVAADLDGRGRRTLLTEEVGALLGLDLREGRRPPSPTGDPRQDLIRALDDQLPVGEPAALGRFAPLPGRVPADPVAHDLLATAGRQLLDAAEALDPRAALPVVLTGSVLASPGPLRDQVEQGLRSRRRASRTVPDGLPGALRLARELAGRMDP